MTQDEIIEMAEQARLFYIDYIRVDSMKQLEDFANLVAAKATEEANAKANASWTLMCKKMVALEREDIMQIIKQTPFSNWFQADLIEAIRTRGEQA